MTDNPMMPDAFGLNPVFARQYVLDKIASGESPGYNVIYGGQEFGDFRIHPNVRVPTPDGNISTAAGRYQFIKPTWDSQAKKLGLTDFTPASQDAAAWDLAKTVYLEKTGRDLQVDAQHRTVDWEALGDTWTSLKGTKNEPAPAPGEAYEMELPDEPAGDSQLGLSLLQKVLANKYEFAPVDYDPFKVEEKIKGAS